MNRSQYATGTLVLSVAFAAVYISNLLYQKAIEAGLLTQQGVGAEGLDSAVQVVLLLIMSACFAATIMIRADETGAVR